MIGSRADSQLCSSIPQAGSVNPNTCTVAQQRADKKLEQKPRPPLSAADSLLSDSMIGAGQLLSKPALSPPLNADLAARPANELGRARHSCRQSLKPACRTAVHRQQQHTCSATAAGQEASPSPAAPVEARDHQSSGSSRAIGMFIIDLHLSKFMCILH